MRIFYVKDFIIRWGALIISVTMHIVIFQSIFIQFPLQPEPFKPKFIFLGRILTTITNPQNTTPQVLPNTDKNIPKIIYSNDQSTNKNQTRVNKPISSPTMNTNKKIHIKTHFLKINKTTQEQGDIIEDDSIPPTINPYRPLRIRQQ